jgi:signal transduction histidine kinase
MADVDALTTSERQGDSSRRRLRPMRRYVRALMGPLLFWVLWVAVLLILLTLMRPWLGGEKAYDQAALQEWLEEARAPRKTLPQLVENYLQVRAHLAKLEAERSGEVDIPLLDARQGAAVARAEIYEHLKALGTPTKMYGQQLPLFPTIYRLEVRFLPQGASDPPAPIVWDAGLALDPSQYDQNTYDLNWGEQAQTPQSVQEAQVLVRHQLHAYSKRQHIEREYKAKLLQFSAVVVAGALLGLTWGAYGLWREQERERHRLLAQYQVDQAERLLLLQEKRHQDVEHKLLEQRLATQAAEQQALELKSQLYASIGIMAGSYAHNIKNLLVRPNDLLRRCLEEERLSSGTGAMLGEVRETLRTVTQRLDQILQTVRRDPTRSEQKPVDLNHILEDVVRTWRELARDRWRVEIQMELAEGPLWVRGDASHLQQAVENLLFNARDAAFDMRNRLRDQARARTLGDEAKRKQALIDAYAWKGEVKVRTLASKEQVILEVIDNGIGMEPEVQRHCLEPHFTTKRDNAKHEGNTTGMGLGLSFVVTILEHHQATLDIVSEPLSGTTFRTCFARVEPAPGGLQENIPEHEPREAT